jgi:hypothetical protein
MACYLTYNNPNTENIWSSQAMSLDRHYNEIKFSDGLRALLSEYYGHAEEESAEITALKHKISGYIEAGLDLSALNETKIRDLIHERR